MSSSQRADMMLNQPLNKVIPHLAVPTIISMLITSIYNMADTYFVSQINTSASGAVGVIFSAMAFIQAAAFTLGIGAGTNVSHFLGANDEETAKTYVSVGVITAFIVGIIIAACCLPFIGSLVRLLGATETIAPYAVDYAKYILLAAPFMMSSLAMNNQLRFQGLAFYGMIGMGIGGVLNIILDPIFIFALQLGTSGAAIATAISQTVSFSILLLMCNLRKDAISVSFRKFRPTRKIYAKIIHNGLPSLGRQGIASVSTIVLNRAAGPYGDAAIAALSIVNRFIMFLNSAIIGFGQGFQPVCGFCYGAKQYRRVYDAFKFCVKVATIVLLIFAAVSMVFSGQIVQLFRRDDLEVIRIGTLSLRLQLCTLPLWGYIIMTNMLTQSIGYGVRATIIACSRQGIFLIPALIILPMFFGLIGIQVSPMVSDVCAAAMSFIMTKKLVRNLKNGID